jgi:VIT1/CCC1 family predicted Fe2+/Mn2+ transporter
MSEAIGEQVGDERQPRTDADAKEKKFVLQYIQPGLAGLMDGSVSTLAPVFAVFFASHNNSHLALIIGFSAAVGAGISMAFSEALSDTGEITGRGNPWLRGGVTGLMTFLGGLGHTLPFLISNPDTALHLAFAVVGVELLIIAYIRYHYFKMNFFLSVVQVIVGGLLVLFAGILLGQA